MRVGVSASAGQSQRAPRSDTSTNPSSGLSMPVGTLEAGVPASLGKEIG